jgi:pimeloyl-ACP methyl ester carboxylesterase
MNTMLHKFCKVSHGELHYLEGGSGRPLIFLPGTGVTSKSFEEIGTVLSKNFHVFIPDLYKGKSKITLRQQSLTDYADLLHEFVTNTGLSNVSLVGYSIGGVVASSYVQRYPSDLYKLIFICTSVVHMGFMERPSRIIKGYLTLAFHSFFSLNGLRILWLWISDGLEYFVRNPGQFNSEIKVGMFDSSLVSVEKMPVFSMLLIAKDDEFVSPDELNQANKNIKNLEIEVVAGKHDWFYFDKELFLKKSIDFLKD